MSYYPTIAEDIARAQQILSRGLAGGDVYAAVELLRSFVAEIARLESERTNSDEAHRLLDLIDAEFRSDPHSVQCFDLRVVARVRVCVQQKRLAEKRSAEG